MEVTDMPYADKEKKAAYQKVYYAKNRDRLLAQKAEYHARPEVKAQQAAYRTTNRERIRAREASPDARERKRKSGRRTAAIQRAKPGYKEKAREYMKSWYAANRDKILSAKRVRPEDKRKTGPPKRFTSEEQATKGRLRAKKTRTHLKDSYIRQANKKIEVAPIVRVSSIITKRVLKGELNVEQANQILERTGSSARIPTPEGQAAERRT